jgi:hypothetical protein
MDTRYLAPVLLLAVTCTAQAPRLPDDFARSAFKVAKLIEGEAGEYRSGTGGVLVPKFTKIALDDLDADAATPDEQLVVQELKSALVGKLSHNTQLSTAAILAESYLKFHAQNHERSDVNALVSRIPQTIAMRQKEAACFEQLETKLRTRDTSPVTTCSTAAMTVPNIEISDVTQAAERH